MGQVLRKGQGVTVTVSGEGMESGSMGGIWFERRTNQPKVLQKLMGRGQAIYGL